jgi:signal transduction histidine kinase/CheY-like chemotaxis protein
MRSEPPLALRARLRRLLAAPRFADPELDRMARGVFTVALVSLAVLAVYMPLASWAPGRQPWLLSVGLFSMGIMAGVAALAKSGRARAAAAIWLSLVFGVTLFGLWREGGLQGTTASNFVLVVLAASLFFPGRVAWGVATAAVATLVLALGLERRGLLVPRELDSAQVLVTLLTQMAVVILLVQLLVDRIRRAERFLRQVADTTPHAIYVYDLDENRLAYGNSAVSDEFGYPVGPGPDRSGAFGRVIEPEDRPRLLEHGAAIMSAADGQVLEVEYRAKRRDGGQRWIRDRARVLDLNEILRDADRLLRRLLPENVEIETVAGGGLGRVRADPTQVEQVIVNLALNARDAMPDGGRLTLATRNVFLDDEYVADHPGARPGPHVQLAVADTGTGIDEATLERIFEPLFTTKAATAGTGLGLATVDGIVRQSGGSIEVRSRPGQGTEFRIFLPRVEAELEPRAPGAEGESAGGSERVLLVEDEAMVRSYARRVLEAAGYRVTALADGREALEAFERDPQAFDALVSDVMLPGRSGPDLVRAVRERRPGLPALLTSGYTASRLAAEGFGPDAPVLAKPFTPRELRRRLRDVLERGAPRPSGGGPADAGAAGALPEAKRR